MFAFAHKRSHCIRPLLLLSSLTQFCHKPVLQRFRLIACITSCLQGFSCVRFGSAPAQAAATDQLYKRLQHLALKLFNLPRYFSRSAAVSGNGMRGALAVEYAFCMLIIAVMMSGVQELFWDMAQGIVDNFNDWVSKPYP